MTSDLSSPLLEVKNLKKYFEVRVSLGGATNTLRAVDDVSLQIRAGETLGIVGESGCGKSTLARLIVGLIKPTAGAIKINGGDIWESGSAGRARRRTFQMVFQNPASSLNPRRTIEASVAEPLLAQGIRETYEAVERMLNLVGLDPKMAMRKPHQLSGGQQQRASIARALIARPSLVVHDESIASLDISLQAQILNLLFDLQESLGTSYLFISHDLAAVQAISHRIIVMYLGEIVESSSAEEFSKRPLHPYSIALLNATLIPDPVKQRKRKDIILRGDVPSPMNPPSGCRFHTRCPLTASICSVEKPELRDLGSNHLVACHFTDASKQLEVPASPNQNLQQKEEQL